MKAKKAGNWTNYRPNRLKKTAWENCTFIYRVTPQPIQKASPKNNPNNDISLQKLERMKIQFLLN